MSIRTAYVNGAPQVRYGCVVCQLVVARDGVSFGRRPVTLPFVPFPGLRLAGLMDDAVEDGMGEEVEAVMWDEIDETFHLHLADDAEADSTLADCRSIYGDGWTWDDDGEIDE